MLWIAFANYKQNASSAN